MQIIGKLEERDAIMHDQHLVLKSGRHASDYINMDFAFPDVEFMRDLGVDLARPFGGRDLDALVAPAIGGVDLLQWVALGLHELEGRWVKIFWAEKQKDGSFAYERARWQHLLRGLRTGGVEDVVTTGGSLADSLVLARAAGAELIVSSAVVKRGQAVDTIADCEFHAQAHVDYPDWDESECPQCALRVPIAIDVAHGAKFKEDHPDYEGGWTELLAA